MSTAEYSRLALTHAASGLATDVKGLTRVTSLLMLTSPNGLTSQVIRVNPDLDEHRRVLKVGLDPRGERPRGHGDRRHGRGHGATCAIHHLGAGLGVTETEERGVDTVRCVRYNTYE